MGRYSEKYWDNRTTPLEEAVGAIATLGLLTLLDGPELAYRCEITDNEKRIVGESKEWMPSKKSAHDAAWQNLIENEREHNENLKQLQHEIRLKEIASRSPAREQETDLMALLIKWGIYIGLFFVAIWLVFAVALPLVVINCALICLVIGLVNKNIKNYMFLLSVLGAIFLLIDYNKGWFTKTLVVNVSFFENAIPFFLYLNISTGLIASYFLIRDLINETRPTTDESEFSKRNLIIMTSLLVIGGATVALQRHFDLRSKIQGTDLVYSNNLYNATNQNDGATKIDSTKMDSAKMDYGTSMSYSGIYPQSSVRLLEPEELSTLNRYDLKIMRNEIFARHGYIFKTAEMKRYFDQQNWYKPLYNDVTNQLTNIEKTNVELIKSYER